MKKVLLVTIGFSPNVGGIETHFDDLVDGLVKRHWSVSVLTYQPLTADRIVPFIERKKAVSIYRAPLFRGLFYKLVSSPALEFLYLTPGLFILLPLVLLFEGKSIDVIHSHGLISGFVSVFWGKIFRKRVVATTHSLYEFPSTGYYRKFAKWIFQNSNEVLCLSNQSRAEIVNLGVDEKKVKRFVYWIDSARFKRVLNAKQKLGISGNFTVLFVGRLVEEKGIKILLESTKKWPNSTKLIIAGIGPLQSYVKDFEKKYPSKLMYAGKVKQEDLPLYYSAADIFIIPSINEEGFGRVILESLLCGTPVIGSRRGAIPEAMDENVGTFIDVSSKNITSVVSSLRKNKKLLLEKSRKARPFAILRYSERNIKTIIDSYHI